MLKTSLTGPTLLEMSGLPNWRINRVEMGTGRNLSGFATHHFRKCTTASETATRENASEFLRRLDGREP